MLSKIHICNTAKDLKFALKYFLIARAWRNIRIRINFTETWTLLLKKHLRKRGITSASSYCRLACDVPNKYYAW